MAINNTPQDDEGFDEYCARMRSDREWGGNQELCAAARLHGVSVIIHQHQAPRMEINIPGASRAVHVCYRGECHYDSVRGLTDPGTGVPVAIRLPGADAADAAGGEEGVAGGGGGRAGEREGKGKEVAKGKGKGKGKGNAKAKGESGQERQERQLMQAAPAAAASLAQVQEALAAAGGDFGAALAVLQAALEDCTGADGEGNGDSGSAGGAACPAQALAVPPAPPDSDAGAPAVPAAAAAAAAAAADQVKGAEEPAKGKGQRKGGSGDEKKVPRKGPCPCGSGVKYKDCCKRKQKEQEGGAAPTGDGGGGAAAGTSMADEFGALAI